jgi:NifU-like protein involved in Fe-S cluster formation/bacterioferritin-associated ferredoxin
MHDVSSKDGKEWFYSEKVKDHFFNPKNLVKTQEEQEKWDKEADGIGTEGSPACGDMMKIWIKVKDNKIIDCKWQTFGCASAIASTSVFSEMVKGKTLEDALKIKPQDIANKLDGLPTRKFHCSVLADKALRVAINDYYKKTKQINKIKEGNIKIIDKILKITDEDIEESVLEGVRTFEGLQKRTKIGVQDKTCIPEAKQLLKYYVEKYFPKEINKLEL